jgi:hypothetical protein
MHIEARLASFAQLFTKPQVAGIASRLSYLVLSGVRDEGRGASGQKQGWCIRRKVEAPKTETADYIGALKSPFLSVVHGVSRSHHW